MTVFDVFLKGLWPEAMISKQHTTRFSVPGKHLAALILMAGGLVLMSVVAGCDGGPGRDPVSGSVALDGRPLEYGVISFRPAQSHTGPGSGGVVNDGSFEIPAAKGLQPGSYKVSITVLKKTGRMIRDFPNGPERPERVPVKINEADQLEATVGAGAENRFEFRLTTKSTSTPTE